MSEPKSEKQEPFEQAKVKLYLGSVDDEDLHVEAQYNPKELQIDQTVPWKKPDASNKSGNKKSAPGEGIALEFSGADSRNLTVEFLFDGYESEGRTVNVQAEVEKLQKMASVINPTSTKEEERRPHLCVVAWGYKKGTGANKAMPSFRCVIASLATKYTMFSSDGVPLRATCTVKLQEADIVDKKKK